jgi:orotidine-5'-phosphate decarboxylase
MVAAREHIAFAADLGLPEALSLYERLTPFVGVVKVGLSLFVEHGPRAVEAFRAQGAQVFLDLKLHDIPNTVELAAARAGALGVRYLTVHASGGRAMLEAAVAGANAGAAKAGHAPPCVLAVTVLTSMSDEELWSLGVEHSALAQVERLARLAGQAGVGGLVCSAREVARVRPLVGPGLTLCTPGIRPVGAQANDQTRVETPAAAIAAGSTLLVVGRPISADPEPARAAERIALEVAAALGR